MQKAGFIMMQLIQNKPEKNSQFTKLPFLTIKFSASNFFMQLSNVPGM